MKVKAIETVTIDLEDLIPPDSLLTEFSKDDLIKKIDSSSINYSVDCEKLIYGGNQAFLYGMYLAYSEHRPFTISPDMIWLLICQGFSNHINANKNIGNDIFKNVIKESKIKVVVESFDGKIKKEQWQEAIERLFNGLTGKVDDELLENLNCDFTTSTVNSNIAIKVTVLDTFKAYFEYLVSIIICGIPKITIEGSKEDWKKILTKVEVFRRFELEWWVNEIIPILQEFINVKDGEIDNEFWMNMFKIHTHEEYGKPDEVDGWVLKFYPYMDNGDRRDKIWINYSNEKRLFGDISKDIVNVPFTLEIMNVLGNKLEKGKLSFNAGFLGLSQNHETKGIRPEMGWYVSENNNDILDQTDDKFSRKDVSIFRAKNLESLPIKTLRNKRWDDIYLEFSGDVKIPFLFALVKFSFLEIKGDISIFEKNKLKVMFAKKIREERIIINGQKLK